MGKIDKKEEHRGNNLIAQYPNNPIAQRYV